MATEFVTTANTSPESRHPWRWLIEPEVLLLIAIVASAYFVRISDLPMRREETLWARVAFEMMDAGDWVIPRLQRETFAWRPPLEMWSIAISAQIRGAMDPIAVRLPTVAAVLAICLMTYGYARTFLSRVGSFTAAIAFASMLQVLEYGRIGETDTLFTLFVAASLFVWHYCDVTGRPALVGWTLGYALAAIGLLTKGIQAPVYFAAAAGVHLVLTLRWRLLFTPAHFLGIATFFAIASLWVVPAAERLDWATITKIWTCKRTSIFAPYIRTFLEYPDHYLDFALEFIVYTMPWSPILLAFLFRGVRQTANERPSPVLFLVGAILTTLPTCWLDHMTRLRYFQPLFPCIAVLIGVVVDRLATAKTPLKCNWAWSFYTGVIGIIVGGTGFVILGFYLWPNLPKNIQPLNHLPVHQVIGFAVIMPILSAILIWSARTNDRRRYAWGVLACAQAMIAFYAGIVVSAQRVDEPPIIAAVENLKQRLPHPERLVTLTNQYNVFAYHYQLIMNRRNPEETDCKHIDYEYFCFNDWEAGLKQPFSFEWELVDKIAIEGPFSTRTPRYVVVGRRLDGLKSTTVELPPLR